MTEQKLSDILAIGNNVTIPTIRWGTWTGEIVAIRECGPFAPIGDVFVTIKDEDGTETEVRTNRHYSGYLNSMDQEVIIATSAMTTKNGKRLQRGKRMTMNDAKAHVIEHFGQAVWEALTETTSENGGHYWSDGIYGGQTIRLTPQD